MLRFRPLFRQYLWGGRRLGQLLGKPIGPEPHYAESWEVVDHGADQSLVADGPLAGTSLHTLVAHHGAALLGRHAPLARFPLLFKFLDAAQQLSVQVHPNDAQAARCQPPVSGKTEAWIVLAAEPGSYLYAGLKPGVDGAALSAAVRQGACESCLHRIEPAVGDCIFLPAGVVHAIGPGLLMAEIQQSSDTTYRLYDWNRRGPDGKPRALHVEQALEVIDFGAGPVAPRQPLELGAGRERLVACDQFVVERRSTAGPFVLEDDHRFHLLAVLSGALVAPGAAEPMRLPRGGVLLVPASAGGLEFGVQGPTQLLDIYLP